MGSQPSLNGFDTVATKEIPETKLAYYAGLFDGEGHVSIYRPSPKHSTTMSLRAILTLGRGCEILEELENIFGGSVFKNKKSGCKYWTVIGVKAGYFLELIYPYVSVKRDEIELALEYHRAYKQIAPSGGFDREFKVPAFLVKQGEDIKVGLEKLRSVGLAKLHSA